MPLSLFLRLAFSIPLPLSISRFFLLARANRDFAKATFHPRGTNLPGRWVIYLRPIRQIYEPGTKAIGRRKKEGAVTKKREEGGGGARRNLHPAINLVTLYRYK